MSVTQTELGHGFHLDDPRLAPGAVWDASTLAVHLAVDQRVPPCDRCGEPLLLDCAEVRPKGATSVEEHLLVDVACMVDGDEFA